MNEMIHDEDIIYKKIDSMSIGDTININDFTIVYGRVGIQVYSGENLLEIFCGIGCSMEAANFIFNVNIKDHLRRKELQQKFFNELSTRMIHGVIYHLNGMMILVILSEILVAVLVIGNQCLAQWQMIGVIKME